MKYYFRYWYKVTIVSFLASLTNRLSFFVFVIAKVLRILFYFVFIVYLLKSVRVLAGYSEDQVVLFFLSFLLVDSLSQLFLRGVYFFRDKVVDGNFDYLLTRPINVLFNVLGSHADIQDVFVSLGILGILVFHLTKMNFGLVGLFAYAVLFLNGILIAVSFHILIAAFILVSLDVDHAILIYRDLESLARFPLEIYREPVRFVFTFVVPLGVMVSFPVRSLLGTLSPSLFFLSFLISIFLFVASNRIWTLALRTYSSASS